MEIRRFSIGAIIPLLKQLQGKNVCMAIFDYSQNGSVKSPLSLQ